MPEPDLHIYFFKCPTCGQEGGISKVRAEDGYRLSPGFHLETRGKSVVVACKCGASVEASGIGRD